MPPCHVYAMLCYAMHVWSNGQWTVGMTARYETRARQPIGGTAAKSNKCRPCSLGAVLCEKSELVLVLDRYFLRLVVINV